MNDIERIGSNAGRVALLGGAATRRRRSRGARGVGAVRADGARRRRRRPARPRPRAACRADRRRSRVRATTAATASRPRRGSARWASARRCCASARRPRRRPTQRRRWRARCAAGVAILDWPQRGARRPRTTPISSSTPCSASAPSRAPEGEIAAAIARIAELAARGARVLAVDVPSGLDVDRGQPIGAACVVADDTLTLIAPKPGLFTGSGRDHAGQRLVRATRRRRRWQPTRRLARRHARSRRARVAPRRHAAHKGSFGDVAVVGGAAGHGGRGAGSRRAPRTPPAPAACSSNSCAATPRPASHDAFDPTRPELMLRPGWAARRRGARRRTTVVCGCGGGDAVRAPLPRLLSLAPRLVLDADALNALAGDASLLALAVARDARGLRPSSPRTRSKQHACSAAPARPCSPTASARRARSPPSAGAVVVLKGSGTVIAARRRRAAHQRDRQRRARERGHRRRAGRLDRRPLGVGRHDVRRSTSRRSARSSTARRPSRRAPGAVRAADLIETLHRRARGG